MAYDINLAAGRYAAHALRAGIYETAGNALMLGVEWELDNPECNTITSRTCLVSKAGIVQEKRIGEIRKWAPGWDGVSTAWFGEHFAELEADLTIKRIVDQYDGREKPEIAFIDPIGGGASHAAIPAADPKALEAKYGARLRALAGTMPKPVAPPPKAKTAEPSPSPSATNADAAKTAGAATATAATDQTEAKKQAAWKAFKDYFHGDGDERNAAWFNMLATAVPNKDTRTFAADDWEAVIAKIKEADKLPF